MKNTIAIDAIPMIPMTHISRLIWNKRLGQKLTVLRGKTPRREVSQKLKTAGFDLSIQGLAKYEKGLIDSVDPKMLLSLLGILGYGVEALYPTVATDYRLLKMLEPISA